MSTSEELAVLDALEGKRLIDQVCPILNNANGSALLGTTHADVALLASNTHAASGLLSTIDALVQKVQLIIVGVAENQYAGANYLDCSTPTDNQWQINVDGGDFVDLQNDGKADGQMVDEDWHCQVEGAQAGFVYTFDITSILTNIDGKIGLRLANARAKQASMKVTLQTVALRIIWRL